MAELKQRGTGLQVLSGDGPQTVQTVAGALGIAHHAARLSPQAKLAALRNAAAAGFRVMMVGDGINDAPALRAAHVSMAPSLASDIGRSAAEFVFTNGRLASVPFVLDIAWRADRLVREPRPGGRL